MSASNKELATPPSTTLSTPSPTELHDQDPMSAEEIAASMSNQKLKHIYLVVATTPVSSLSGTRLGIGINGQLPWPTIRADMNYFKSVTRDGSSTSTSHGLDPANTDKISNAVIMGRKTWSSIPASFRPLSHRVNVIVTRSKPSKVAKEIAEELQAQKHAIASKDEEKQQDMRRKAEKDSSGIAAQQLKLAEAEGFEAKGNEHSVAVSSVPQGKIPGIVVEDNLEAAIEHFARADEPGEVYCIGGAEVYGALLKSKKLRPRLRILQTEIIKLDKSAFECDTYWPEELEGSDDQWQEVATRDLESWTGIPTPQGTLNDWAEDEKVGVRLRVRGWQCKG